MALASSNAPISGPKWPRVRSLPIEQWPAADRNAWTLACRPSQRLTRGGAGAHLKPVTLSDLARRYGYFLDFLERSARLDRHATAAGQVTTENVAGHIEELNARVSSVTTYGSIYKLRRASQLLDASRNFGWLAEYEKDLALVMRPRSKADRFVLTEVLVECGLTLMTEAEDSAALSQLGRAARQFRNGLMIAMLALHPIRLKNFASLDIGHDFVEIDDQWWIVLSSKATKEARPDERLIDEVISSALTKYLSSHRPALARESNKSSALWMSSISQPLTYHGVAGAIGKTTRMALGVGISPHMFRTSAASSAAVHASDNPHLASALLHHRDSCVTEEHYNRASSLSAATAFGTLIKNL